jgi:hypothetical protein
VPAYVRWLAVVVMARKVGSTQRGHRVAKRDSVPPDATRYDEISEEITDNLRPWKRHANRNAITAAVNYQLDALRKLAPLQERLFDAGQYREHARKIDKAFENVEKLLKSAPAMLALSLFDPLPRLEFTDDDRYPLAQPMPYKSIEEIERAFKARAGRFYAELDRLRKICARKPGTHQNYDHAKHLCARFAYGLMQGQSDREITGTADQSFRNIASLMYEAVSGRQNADLKRACDELLREKRRT